jgi:pimeloyl-ACP methyl ester carboxylesterase
MSDTSRRGGRIVRRASAVALVTLFVLLVSPIVVAQDAALVVAKQGSFFIGGEARAIDAGVTITVNQMYVEYQIPVADASGARPAIVLVHGCCLSAKSWEETPDGRMGWSEYFVRQKFPTYLVDQVTRARSGFDPTIFTQVRTGAAAPDKLPSILTIGHEATWTAFRFGPTPGTPYPDTQFPVDYADEFYKQMIPDLNLLLGPYSGPNPTFNSLSSLASTVGGAILIGHSESGFFPENAALVNADNIRGMISIEPGGSCTPGNPLTTPLSDEQIARLATIPTLILYGDHLSGGFARSYENCRTSYVPRVEAAGGDITFISLPEMEIVGNSHMLMLDRNNLEIADIIIDWIDNHASR